MQVQCPSCAKLIDAADDRAGQVVACPGCGGQMQLPAANVQTVLDAQKAPVGTAEGGAETKACPYCGEAILKVAKKCKHCGSFLAVTGGGTRLPQGKLGLRDRLRRRASGDGRTSIVFGVIGLIPICTAPVFAALAIIYGLGARKNEAERGSGTIGLVLGIVDLLLLLVYSLLVAMRG